MTIRLLCDARGKHRTDIIDRLVSLSKGEIEVVSHFGHSEADFHAPSLHNMRRQNGKRGQLMQAYLSTGANYELIGSPAFRNMMESAVDQFHRTAPAYRYRSHNLQNLQDYLDYYHLLTDAVAQEIQSQGVTHALFLNVPHLGYDTVLYQVAKSLGLRTIILSQTIFPGLFYSVENIQDIGTVPNVPSDAAPLKIDQEKEPHLFYMDDRWQKTAPRGRMTAGALFNFLTYVLVKSPSKLLAPRRLWDMLKRISSIYGALPDWRDPFAKFFHENELAYFEHLAQYETIPADMSGKFVYVPLHNQPEMSTSALGGPWRDQVLMIEAISRNLPEGWKILVKENPRQGAYDRGPFFWHRLNRIAGLQFVPSDTSTYELSSKAQFVATVTGTAGWEAIRKGRPAVVFGNAWYKDLPGVVKYRDGLNFEEIAASTIDHPELERRLGALMARYHEGLIEQVYLKNIKEFDPVANLDSVAQTTLGLLKGTIPLTFSTDVSAPQS